ncbi:MAG: hypothetical protein ABI067_06170 [Leifsonia sp.]
MDTQPDTRGRHLGPARLLIGSVIAGAGIAVLGFFLGGNSASAAEPTPPPVPAAHSLGGAVGSAISGADSVVSSTVSKVGGAVGAVVQPVVAALPQPVPQAVATVTAPVVDAVQDVAASAPASQVITPVASAVDGVVNSIPLAHELLGDNPVGTVIGSFGSGGGTPGGQSTGVSELPVLAAGAGVLGTPVLGIPLAVRQIAVLSTDAAGALPAAIDPIGAPPAAGSRPAPDAPAFPGGRAPVDPLASTSSSSWTSGAGAPGLGTAVPSDAFALVAAVRGSRGAATDDRLPVSPVADHDTSPD